MTTIAIYLRSGRVIRFRARGLTVTTNGLGNITKLEWTEASIGILRIDLAQIDAVIEETP